MRLRITACCALVVGSTWLAGSARGSTQTLYATQDCYVRSTDPNTNYNTGYLYVGSLPLPRDYVTFIKFDVSTIPAGSTINSATLSFACTTNGNYDYEFFNVYELSSSWTETGATWNNGPSWWTTPYSQIYGGDPGTPVWLDWDVTDLVDDWVNGSRTNYGFAVMMQGNFFQGLNARLEFHSSENTAVPSLYVNFTVLNPAPQLSLGSVSPSSGNTSDNFYYYVKYYDPGDAPSYVRVYVDGTAHSMSLYSGTSDNGTYRWGPTTLSDASHTYYFTCLDGVLPDRLPSSGSYSGPTVTLAPTPPSKATNPSPSNGASSVSINTNLSWSNGGGATSYRVYFGTDSTPDSGEDKGEQSGTTYDPGTLNYSTTYYWRIDAKNSYGTTTGNVWYFTTGSAPPTPPPPPDGDGGGCLPSGSASALAWLLPLACAAGALRRRRKTAV